MDCLVECMSNDRPLMSASSLQGANAHLRMQVQELSSEGVAAREEANALQGLQDELCSRVPNMDKVVATALSRERVLQDARNSKVLELLACKVALRATAWYGSTRLNAISSHTCYECHNIMAHSSIVLM